MPIHDWSRVDGGLFHHFHQAWTIRITDALNGGLLPNGFAALIEQKAAGLEPDVVALQLPTRNRVTPDPRGGGVLTVEPVARHVIQASDTSRAARANRIVIRHRMGRVVCMIELVSPGNKSSRSALRSFVNKSIEFLEAGVHLLLVDLFPPTPRDPQGIHKAIWDEIDEQPFELPPTQPLTLAAYVASQPRRAYVEPIGVGEAMPDMPAYLDVKAYVPVPLEATYQTTWDSCPEGMRDIIEGREIADDSDV